MERNLKKTKITMELPVELLENARKVSGKGITATVCQGLQLVASAAAYKGLRDLRGKVKFSLDLEKLRID